MAEVCAVWGLDSHGYKKPCVKRRPTGQHCTNPLTAARSDKSAIWAHEWSGNNGWSDRDGVLGADVCGSKDQCVRWKSRSNRSLHEGWQVGDAAFFQITLDTCWCFHIFLLVSVFIENSSAAAVSPFISLWRPVLVSAVITWSHRCFCQLPFNCRL